MTILSQKSLKYETSFISQYIIGTNLPGFFIRHLSGTYSVSYGNNDKDNNTIINLHSRLSQGRKVQFRGPGMMVLGGIIAWFQENENGTWEVIKEEIEFKANV